MDPNQTYHEMSQLAAAYAKAEADRVYLAEFRKSKKALLMKSAEVAQPGLAVNAQEREAYAHSEYLEVLKGLQAATEVALFSRFKLKQYEMKFEAWRTRQANDRAQMNIR